MFNLYFGFLLFSLIVFVLDFFGLVGGSDDGGGDDGGGENGDSSDITLPDQKGENLVLKLLNYLRLSLYFSLGFGAVGVFGTLYGENVVLTLLYSIGTGIATVFIVKFISRFQRNSVDSQIKEVDLFMAKAEVIVSIKPRKIGRVRVHTGGRYQDLYARGKDQDVNYAVGAKVTVVDVSQSELVVEDSDKVL